MDESSASPAESEGNNMCIRPSEPVRCYEIKCKGHLDDHWAAWFHGCSLTQEDDGTTTLVGPIRDQAELFGLLNKVRDLSFSVISVNEIEPPDGKSDL